MDTSEMQAIVAGISTTSDKIRLLYRSGVPKADLARFLGIRYNHVYNVLWRDKQGGGGESAKRKQQTQVFSVKLEAQGRLTVPHEFAEEEGLKTGDVLICRRDPDGLKIMTPAAAEDYFRTILRQRLPEQTEMLEALLNAKGRFRNL